MKKVLFICLLCTFVFAFENQNKVEAEAYETMPMTGDYLSPTTHPLVTQMREARKAGDMVTYQKLLATYKNQLPKDQVNGPPIIAEKIETEPIFRWGEDIIIWNGSVYYDAWTIANDLDDESISIDYHRGDTLIAAIGCADSTVKIFRSFDNGQTWAGHYSFSLPGYQLSEPEAIYGPGGIYHVTCRNSYNNGTINCINVQSDGAWTAPYITTTSDTIRNYTVCSDRVDYTGYWFFLFYHRGRGGADHDECWFTRSLDYGETWETPALVLSSGSSLPDITYGSDDQLWMTRIWKDGAQKRIRAAISTNSGNAWTSHTTIYSDTSTKRTPQIAAAHNGSGDAWIICPDRDASTSHNDYGLLWSWSENWGANWSGVAYVQGWVDYMEILPSISIPDNYGTTYWNPYVTFIRSYWDWTDRDTYTFWWDSSDSTWTDTETYNDHEPELIRPSQTREFFGGPAMAYVGSGGTNVYFDSWINVDVEENEDVSVTRELACTVRPNPFTSTSMARIEYTLPSSGRVTAKVYNALGQVITTLYNGVKESGTHELQWNAADLPKGIYFLKIETDNDAVTKKVILE